MSRLKITGGHAKGRVIATATGKNGVARYTSSKVREAIFNILGDVRGAKVLDLFAGAGSFTIEALSRGAASATCVEKDRNMAAILEKNLSSLSLDKYCLVLNMDVRHAIPFLYKKTFNYDIIFMDPPYDMGFLQGTMALLENNAVYDENTLFVMEHSRREAMDPAVLTGWREVTARQYGDTNLTILRVK